MILVCVLLANALAILAQQPQTQPAASQPAKIAPKNQKPLVERKYQYYEIPLVGTFGKEIQPSGVEDALSTAVRQKIDFVVFRIDSPGGFLASGKEIAAVLAKYDSSLDYIAIIEHEACSAALWVVFSCDRIFISSGAKIGAGTVYLKSNTGEVTVDAKMNSAVAAELAAIAENKHHSAILARAMVLLDAKAFLLQPDSSGKRIIQADAPLDGHAFETLDSETTILTLTSDEAMKSGLAESLDCSVEKLGPKIGHARWERKGDYGRRAMQRALDSFTEATRREAKVEQLLNDRPAIVRFINANTDDAYAKDPDNFSYRYYVDEKGFRHVTVDSWNRWYSNTDAAVWAWQRVVTAIQLLTKLEQEADRRGEQRSSDDLDLVDHYNRATREIQRLQGNRSHGPPM